jgi:hypothetical protein
MFPPKKDLSSESKIFKHIQTPQSSILVGKLKESHGFWVANVWFVANCRHHVIQNVPTSQLAIQDLVSRPSLLPEACGHLWPSAAICSQLGSFG